MYICVCVCVSVCVYTYIYIHARAGSRFSVCYSLGASRALLLHGRLRRAPLVSAALRQPRRALAIWARRYRGEASGKRPAG